MNPIANTPPTFAYVARNQAGCVTLLTTDIPEMAKDNATYIGKALRLGNTIDRMTVEDARKAEPFCRGKNCPRCAECEEGIDGVQRQ